MEEVTITLDEAFQVLVTGCFLTLFTSFIAWKMGFYSLNEEPLQEGEKLPFSVVLIAFAIFLAASIFLVPVLFLLGAYFYSGSLEMNPDKLIILSTFTIIASFISLNIFYFLLSRKNRDLITGKLFGPKIGLKKTLKDIFFGVLTWFVSFPVVMVVGKLVYILLYSLGLEVVPNQTAVSMVKTALSTPSLFITIALTVVFLVPVIEEFLFRGVLQTWAKGRMGITKAILLSSLIFALFHFSWSQGLGNIELLISLFVLSCFLGFIYEKQQSLISSISLHAFFNAVTVLMILLE